MRLVMETSPFYTGLAWGNTTHAGRARQQQFPHTIWARRRLANGAALADGLVGRHQDRGLRRLALIPRSGAASLKPGALGAPRLPATACSGRVIALLTRTRPGARGRGSSATVMWTSWPSAVSSRIRRSLEKLARRPLTRAETLGWSRPISSAAAAWVRRRRRRISRSWLAS